MNTSHSTRGSKSLSEESSQPEAQTPTVYTTEYDEQEGQRTKLPEVYLDLIDVMASERCPLRKLAGHFIDVSTNACDSNVVGVMTDAVRCIAWESLHQDTTRVFHDANYKELIKLTVTFTYAQLWLRPKEGAYQYYQTLTAAVKSDWAAAVLKLMKTHQKQFLQESLKPDFCLDGLGRKLERASQGLMETERVRLYTLLRSDYPTRRDFHAGITPSYPQDQMYSKGFTTGIQAESCRLTMAEMTDLTLTAMRIKDVTVTTSHQYVYMSLVENQLMELVLESLTSAMGLC